MISRRTTLLIAELYTRAFQELRGNSRHHYSYWVIDTKAVYDFLFVNDHPAWFCNMAAVSNHNDTRTFKEFILKVHTGESLTSATQNWTWPQREKLGQQFLKELAEDIFKFWAQQEESSRGSVADKLAEARQSLELDGYAFRGDTLLAPEEDVLDVKEESGVLQNLYRELRLPNEATVFHHLALSEEHYLAQRWDDSISNSRKFLEAVLQEVAAGHYSASRGTAIPDDVYSRPARIRDYLESGGLLESKEKHALSSVYGLLSETGGHPYMAQSEQARLLRHLALTLAQFALLRLQGFRKAA